MEEHQQPETSDDLPPTRSPSMGDCFIALGSALNNPESTLHDLVRLAMDCGLILTVSVTPNDPIDIEVITE